MNNIADYIVDYAKDCYKYLHQHPELSFEEENTSKFIRRELQKLGIEYHKVGDTGTIAKIYGINSHKCIGIRADIDALPITECDTHSLRSINNGIMHACGHDIHTSCLLGVAKYMVENGKKTDTNIILIFQHGEEELPGGALDFIKDDFFKANKPDWMFGLHVDPDIIRGAIGLCSGEYMASGDEIYIDLKGEGGHAALPHKSSDLVLIASHIIVALQQISSRIANPLIPTVLTFGNIVCDSKMNIIPSKLRLEGTFRTFNEKWREEAKTHITEISTSIAESMGALCDVNIIKGYPCLYNDPFMTNSYILATEREIGRDNVIKLDKRMTTDDFARYAQIIPSTYIRLGVKEIDYQARLHTSSFKVSEYALDVGMKAILRAINIFGELK